MTNISFGGNFRTMAKKFAETGHKRLQTASAVALTSVAFKAREAVQTEMRSVFKSPTRFTLSSVRVQRAEGSAELGAQFARVYLRDDYPKTNTSPAKYLLAEELGGLRGNKRSENALVAAGLLMPGEQTSPAQGPISGPMMVRLLSSIKAFSEVGFNANATERTKRRLRSKKAFQLKQTGTPYFVAKSRLGEGHMGIFQIFGRGKVKPVLWFDTRRPNYRPIFGFTHVVQKAVLGNFVPEMEKALAKLIAEKPL